MLEQKTLKETSEECHISMSTAFTWRHKILDTLSELTERTYLTGIVEADETFFNVSYKGKDRRIHKTVVGSAAMCQDHEVLA